jgi:alpha-tubulin suppressor-like RCC1 family protein
MAYCWGRNNYGQMGRGSTSDIESTPTQVPLVPLSQIVAGGNHTCALTSDGTPYCWGRNADYELGDGTKTYRYSPTPVVAGEGYPFGSFGILTAGAFHTCGLTPEGVAWCWGDNVDWQIGDGTYDDRSNPVPVQGGHLFGRPAPTPVSGRGNGAGSGPDSPP